MRRHTRAWLASLCALWGIGTTPVRADEPVWQVNPAESKPLRPAKIVVTPEGAAAKSMSVANKPADDSASSSPLEGFLQAWPDPARRPYVWAHFDLLLWRVTNGPVRVPVLTENNNPNSVGSINEAGTRVLVGGTGRDIRYEGLQGLRISAGAWLDADGHFGVELAGFRMEPDMAGYVATTGGVPTLAIPVNSLTTLGANPAGETALNSGGSPSAIRIRGTADIWGTELNALFVANPEDEVALGLLFGGRYLNFSEKFELTDIFYDTMNTGTIAVRDSFETRNHFGGVNLGAQARWNLGRWQASLGGKVAVGIVRQNLDVRGETVINGSAFGMANASFPGGVFSQASNIGNYTQDRLGVLPEANFRLAFAVTQNLRVSVGYDALFMNSVLRPGNQLDRNVNLNQSVLFGNGALLPQRAPAVSESSLWMHGVNFGIGLSY